MAAGDLASAFGQALYTGHYGDSATARRQPFSGIVVHVTGKQNLQDELQFMRNPAPGSGGYLGYHFLVDRDGQVYQTAPFDARTNHILPDRDHSFSNDNSLGVALVGAAKGATPAQMQAAKGLVSSLSTRFDIPANRVVGHGDIQTDRGEGSNLNPDGGAEGKDFLSFYRTGIMPTATASASAAPAAGSGFVPPRRPSTPVTALDLVAQLESGNRNIKQQIVDANTARGTPAGGYYQIIDPTWAAYAPKAGVDLKRFPTAMSADRDTQTKVASVIPVNQWGPNTVKALQAQYAGLDTSRTLGEVDGAGSTAVASIGASDAAPNADDWRKILGADAPPESPDLSSVFADAASPVSMGLGGASGASGAPTLDTAPAYTVPVPDIAASATPEELSARYDATKATRRAMAPLADLFTLKTIGQPASRMAAAQPYQRV